MMSMMTSIVDFDQSRVLERDLDLDLDTFSAAQTYEVVISHYYITLQARYENPIG